MRKGNIEMIKICDLKTRLAPVPGQDDKAMVSCLVGRALDGSSYFVVPNRNKGKAKVKGKQQDQPNYFLFIGQRTEPEKIK